MPCLAIRGDERTDCSVFNKLGNARHDQFARCRLMPMAMPKRLFIFWERFENAFRDNVFDADQARVGRVPIIDDALDELLGEVVAEVVRLDLSPHIVSIEMEPVQIHIDRTNWAFALDEAGTHPEHLALSRFRRTGDRAAFFSRLLR
jgi:hypothetical protein